MSTAPATQHLRAARPWLLPRTRETAHLVLIGTGGVGAALLEQLAERALAGDEPRLVLVGVANSRRMLSRADGVPALDWRNALEQHGDATDVEALLRSLTPRFARLHVIDATASGAIAARHAHWLSRGLHVITANKLGGGAGLSRWREIAAAARAGNAGYGISTTVGAGLPVLRSLAELAAAGDPALSIRAVCSGSLAFVCERLGAGECFSRALDQAMGRGYTEPDPRTDLAGTDVARKLLILARTAGYEPTDAIAADNALLPPHLAHCPLPEFLARTHELDEPLARQFDAARAAGKVLRYVARFDPRQGAQVGLTALAPDHALAASRGADNVFEIATRRYRERPLVIQGPGAGPEITAAGLLRDVLSLSDPA